MLWGQMAATLSRSDFGGPAAAEGVPWRGGDQLPLPVEKGPWCSSAVHACTDGWQASLSVSSRHALSNRPQQSDEHMGLMAWADDAAAVPQYDHVQLHDLLGCEQSWQARWGGQHPECRIPTADAQQPEEADEDANVGVHQAKGDHGNALSDDEVDEEVAAVGYGSPNEGRDLPCSKWRWQSRGDAGGQNNLQHER